jgi:serine protease Do
MTTRQSAALLALILFAGTAADAAAQTIGEVYRRISSSVVVIRAKGREVTSGGVSRFTEIGSGVLISPDGKIATAAHVVHLMEDITVEFLGEEPIAARVIASEPRADLSLIQVSVVPRDATVAVLANSDEARTGDPIFVVGAPYGLRYSLSIGVISARWEPNTVSSDFPLAEFFQTDAAINTGNSGGPMFSRSGQLLGIVSHNITKSGGSEGLGFVVASNSVKKLLLERAPVWYGVDTQFVSGDAAAALGLPPRGAGLLVKQVVKGSIAADLGLRGGDRLGLIEGQQTVVGGDVILKIQDVTLTAPDDVATALRATRAMRPGQDLRVTVLRGGRVVDLVAKWPAR